MGFDGGLVLVTGAASGIGAAVAITAAEHGGRPVLFDRDAYVESSAEALRHRWLRASPARL